MAAGYVRLSHFVNRRQEQGLFIGLLISELARAKLIYWTNFKKSIASAVYLAFTTEVQLARSR